MCDLLHVQLQELVQFVHICKVLIDKLVRSSLQLGTVKALGQCTDTCGINLKAFTMLLCFSYRLLIILYTKMLLNS